MMKANNVNKPNAAEIARIETAYRQWWEKAVERDGPPSQWPDIFKAGWIAALDAATVQLSQSAVDEAHRFTDWLVDNSIVPINGKQAVAKLAETIQNYTDAQQPQVKKSDEECSCRSGKPSK